MSLLEYQKAILQATSINPDEKKLQDAWNEATKYLKAMNVLDISKCRRPSRPIYDFSIPPTEYEYLCLKSNSANIGI